MKLIIFLQQEYYLLYYSNTPKIAIFLAVLICN